MKKLILSDEKALELYKTADASFKQLLEENWGKEFFNPKLITDIVYDIPSLMKYLNITESQLYIYLNPKTDFERYINACSIIPKIVSVYNEGIILDWNNSNQYKYIPYYRKTVSGWSFVSGNSWASSANGPYGHHYKSENLCEKAYENFNSIYIDFYSYSG